MQDLVDRHIISMSLREISEVLKLSRPDNIISSAQKLVALGVISFCTSKAGAKIDQRLNRIDSITLVAQNNPAFTKAIVEKLDELENKPVTYSVLEAAPLAITMAKAFGFTGNQALLSADRATKSLTGYSPLELMGQTKLIEPNNTQYLIATELGLLQEPQISAIKVNRKLSDLGYQDQISRKSTSGKVKKKWTVTTTGQEFSQILDTNKKYSDGTPVQQIKWSNKIKF
jgi:hypothetical protein